MGHSKKPRPVTEEAVAALEEVRSKATGLGEAPVLPAAKDPSAGVSRWLLHHRWERGREARRPGAEAGKGLALAQAEVASD